MDRASSLIFPGSRILAGWWRQLHPWQPLVVHVGYGFVHRVEALVQVLRSQPIDSFTHLILQALALQSPENEDPLREIGLQTFAQRLGLPKALLQQILIQLEANGLLAQSTSTGRLVTERGRIALVRREYPVHLQERCVLTFLEQLNAFGQRLGPPFFLPIAECTGSPWRVDDAHRFELSFLQDCITQSADWKRLHAFPQEIEALIQNGSLPNWQRVIVDRPERLLFLLILTGKLETAEWLGFAIKADGWELLHQAPMLRIPASQSDGGMKFVEKPNHQAWQDAWRAWCRQRNLPMNEADSCSLTYQSPRLEVQAPERFVQRLRAAKSDLLKGEAWILVGDGYLRTAALLTLVPISP